MTNWKETAFEGLVSISLTGLVFWLMSLSFDRQMAETRLLDIKRFKEAGCKAPKLLESRYTGNGRTIHLFGCDGGGYYLTFLDPKDVIEQTPP